MLKYNWKTMKESTKCDVDKIKEYFTNVYLLKGTAEEYLLNNAWAREIYNAKPKDSFILNIEGFVKNYYKATKLEQFIYLDLLSKRNVFSYYNTKGKVDYLAVWKVEKLYDIQKLKANRLLNIEENNIYFVYEQENTEWE